MANILDYILWRGDLSFKQSCFNEVDAVILCQISYLNYDGLLTDDLKAGVTLNNLWNAFKHTSDFKKRCDLGALINSDTYKVLEAAANSKRFSDVKACAYVNKIDRSIDEQFSAVTYFLSGTNKNPYVVFKGTDDTLTGWKEDFNMSFSTSVTAQKDAVSYIDRISKSTHGKINILGHSKGGNLAVYAACYMKKYFKQKIMRIYNFDGPGFPKDMIDSREFNRIKEKIATWYPQKDLVGMFFEHAEKYTVVKSSASGAWQHDAMSWFVEGGHFVTEAQLDKRSVYFNKIFNSWLKTVAPEKLKQVTDMLFEFLENKR